MAVEVPDQVVQLVVPEQRDHATAGARSLVFEAHHQVEHLADPRAAVHQIPGLDEDRLPTNPSRLGVDQSALAQDLDKARILAMDVADGDDPRHLGGGRRRGRGQPGGQRQGEGDAGASHDADRSIGPETLSRTIMRNGARTISMLLARRSKRSSPSFDSTRLASAASASLERGRISSTPKGAAGRISSRRSPVALPEKPVDRGQFWFSGGGFRRPRRVANRVDRPPSAPSRLQN